MNTLTPAEGWTKPAPIDTRLYAGPVAINRRAGLPTLLAWLENDLQVVVGVADENGAVTATTQSTQSWPEVELSWPRDTWPRETYTGKGVKHDCVPELRAILDAEIADYLADEGDDE